VVLVFVGVRIMSLPNPCKNDSLSFVDKAEAFSFETVQFMTLVDKLRRAAQNGFSGEARARFLERLDTLQKELSDATGKLDRYLLDYHNALEKEKTPRDR